MRDKTKKKAANLAWRKANPGKVRAGKRTYRANNPEKSRAANARWKTDNIERVRLTEQEWKKNNPQRVLANRLRRNGVTVEQYEAMLVTQNGVCAVCHEPESIPGQRLAIDHDHGCCSGVKSCGKCIRGLLCGKCNKAMGLLGDRVTLLLSAVAYLKGHEPA